MKRKAVFKRGDKVRHKSFKPEEIGTVFKVEADLITVEWTDADWSPVPYKATDKASDLIHADSVINVQPEAEAAFVALANALGYEVKKVD